MADLGALLGAAGVGGAIGQAIVRLELDTSKYSAELKAAQGQTVAGTNAMGASVSKFAGIGTAAFAAVGIAAVAGAAASIKAASDLNEQINKTRVVFKASADDVLAFSETTAKSFGISETAALEAAGSFGQIFDAAGLAESATSDMSIQLVKLAADLASFNNIDPTEALQKLQSGLAGQARPLREVGVFLSAARVEAEAYGSGIARVGEELTDAQKIQARYNIILQDTQKAQGDFQRTVGESLPNQIRVLKAELEDLAAKIGEALMPIIQAVIPVIQDMVEALGPLLDLLGKLGPVVKIAGEALTFLISPLLKLSTILPESGFNEDLARLNKELQPAAERMFEFGRSISEKATPAVKKFIPFLFQVGEATKEGMGGKAQDAIKDFTVALSETAEQTKITRNEFMDATRVMQREARQLSDALKVISKEKWLNDEYVKFLSEQGPEWLIGFANLTKGEMKKAQDAWEEATGKTDKANRSLETIVGTLAKLDKGESRHKVVIEYEYVGFDPSKPGMASAGRTGRGGQQ